MSDIEEIIVILGVLFPVVLMLSFAYRLARIKHGAAPRQGAGTPDGAIEIERIRAKDRADARALYERVTRDKLDVLKTAITMGYDKQELRELDARLEQLIGTEKLQTLLHGPDTAVPPLTSQLLDADLAQERENLKPRKEPQAQ